MAEEWYVRSSDGNVYGPTDRASLRAWAQEGRIEPSGFVSNDRRNWMSAPLMAELEMKWVVEPELGKFFGPFNRDVVSRLSVTGAIPRGARIYRMHELPVDQDPAPQVVEKIVEKRVEVPVEKVVEKDVPVTVEKVVVKEVPVEKIVEKRVEVPVEKIVEKVVVKEVPVEKIVVKRVEVPVEKIVEKVVVKEVPVEKIVEKVVEKEVIVEVPVEKVVYRDISSAPRTAVLEPEVVDVSAPMPPAKQQSFGGIFKGADRASMAALEAAARRELSAAKRNAFGGFFSRRKP